MGETSPAKKKGYLYVIVGVLVFFAFVIFCAIKFGIPESSVFSTISKDISLEQSKNAQKIFKDIGIEKIDEVKADDLLNHDEMKGFRVKSGGLNLVSYFINGNLSQVKFADNLLYKDGKLLASIKDYTLSIKEQSDLQFKCQEGVKSILKTPSTAVFPNILEWKFNKNKERIIVQSYVEAQNSFGAKIRSTFQVVFTPEGTNIKSLIFDEREYVK